MGWSAATRAARWLSLAELAWSVAAFEQVASLPVEGSGENITIITAVIGADDTDLTTFVPDCEEYATLPCACEHALLSPDHGGFWPSFDHLWHKPSLERLLHVQRAHVRTESELRFVGGHFWHASGFGNYRNSLDTAYHMVVAYRDHFPHACMEECRLTGGLLTMLNWLVTLKQVSIFPASHAIEAYRAFFNDMADFARVDFWRRLPWYALLDMPAWSETFVYIVEQLEDTLAEFPDFLGGPGKDLQHTLQRMGIPESSCAALVSLQQDALTTSGDLALAIARLQLAAFDAPCFVHFATNIAVFGAAVRPLLAVETSGWPVLAAEAAETTSIWRFCGGITQRRVGQVELHFLAADVIQTARKELEVEVLWMATSDDRCIMTSTFTHNKDDAYYSFLHTLPHSYLMHWECAFSTPSGLESLESPNHSAASTTLAGFAVTTACRVPPIAAKWLKTETRPTASLALHLRAAWQPEPLHLCPVPRRPRRRLAACSSPLHDAGRVHELLPHAVEDWLNYHFAIGVEHFTVFDTDGSFAPFVQPFVERGLVTYYGRFPYKISPKLGFVTAQLKNKMQERKMLLEPHALELCMWENRQVSDWVVAIHSFEEYLHSPFLREKLQDMPLGQWLQKWSAETPGTAVFEVFQEPMGGPMGGRMGGELAPGRSIFTTWTQKRGVELSDAPGMQGLQADAQHFRSFAWIVDPVNVVQSFVHLAQPRADGQNIVALHKDVLRVNHYLDLGSAGGTSRCWKELGGCDVLDSSLTWAEEIVVAMRQA